MIILFILFSCAILFLAYLIINGGLGDTSQPASIDKVHISMTEVRVLSGYPMSYIEEYKEHIQTLPKTIEPSELRARAEEWALNHPNPILYFKIAGINKRTGIKSLVGNVRIILEEEPTNPHDPNAIKVIHKGTGKHLGYVPADYTATIRSLVPSLPCETVGEIHTFTDDLEDRKYLAGTFQIDTRPL